MMVDKLPPVNLTKIDELLISFCIAPRHFIETFEGVCNLYTCLAYGGDIFLGQKIKNKLSAPRNLLANLPWAANFENAFVSRSRRETQS